MRVLHVINGLTTGGAEAVLYRLATYPSDVGHEVVCLEGRDWYSGELEARGVRVLHLNSLSAASVLLATIQLFRLIKRSRPDVVQAWMYRSNIIASIAAKLAGVPVIWNIRCSSVKALRPRSRLLAYVGGFFAPWFASAVINCSATSRKLHARLGYDSVPGIVIPNGYDAAVFGPNDACREDTRGRLGIAPGSFAIGSIGRWDPHKGYPVLFRALKLLNDRRIDVRMVLVGRDLDPTNPELVRLIEECGCTGLVEALGHRLDIPDIARALDLHVLASVSEGFPNVVAETMLSETPNVATNVGDAGVIVGDTGWLVESGDAPAVADAIERAHREWSDSPGRWRERRAAARRRITSNFSIARVFGCYKHVWQEVASKRPLKGFAEAEATPGVPTRSRDQLSEKAPRVLHVINSLVLGGAETLLYRLVSRGTAAQHVVVSLGPPGWYSERLQEKGFEVHHLGMDSPFRSVAAAASLKKIVTESGADVIQCWMYRSNVFGGLVAKAVGKPVVWGIHCASLKPLRPLSQVLARFSAVLARWNPNYVIICSREAAVVHEKLGYPASTCQIIHNGYDPATFFPDEAARAATRRALGAAPSDFLLGTVSRWDPLKDIPNLLAALRAVRDHGIPLRCILIGAGLEPTNAGLTAELQRFSCVDFVQPLGPRHDIQDLARALDLHVLASLTEAFPNVVAETMLSGTPNVATNVGDSALMVGTTGWLVPAANPQQLADAIIAAFHEYSERPVQWAARREAAREQIASNFSLDQMAHAYERVWRAAMA